MVSKPNSTGKVVNSDVVASNTADASADLTPREWDESDFRNIGSMQDAVNLFSATTGGDIAYASEELGDGFDRFAEDEKRKLVGVPLFVMEWRFQDSDTVQRGGESVEYVTARVVAERGGKVVKAVISDGSTGIYRQLRAYTNRTGRTKGLMVPAGLRVSDYTYQDPNTGEKSPASTFYFDLSE
jgi:hypothetical protein